MPNTNSSEILDALALAPSDADLDDAELDRFFAESDAFEAETRAVLAAADVTLAATVRK